MAGSGAQPKARLIPAFVNGRESRPLKDEEPKKKPQLLSAFDMPF
jgi:hypothetical protein